MNNPSTARRSTRRCPSCGSRVAEDAASCPICGHEFGTTQAIPRVAPEEKPESETYQLDADEADEDEAFIPARQPPPSVTALAQLPWGVMGVALMIALIAVGALFLLQRRGLAQPAVTPTIEIILNNANSADQVQAGVMIAEATQPPPTATNAPPTDTPQPTPTDTPPVEYTVKRGDTCGGIAQSYGVPLEEFTALNQLDSVNCLIRIGDRVRIPVPTPTPGPTATLAPGVTPPPTSLTTASSQTSASDAAGPTATLPPQIVYVVKGGDTCGEIAQKFNITLELLMQQNNLDANCLIGLNQVLTITFATATPVVSPTPFILQTPTPRVGYSAPIVTSPQDSAQISETQEIITLQWLTVGLLKPDEWYVVQVQPSGAITVPLFETKATSLKLTQDILGDQEERAIAWWVQVKRAAGNDPSTGARTYVEISSPSAVRRFTWRRPLSTATPTPGQ